MIGGLPKRPTGSSPEAVFMQWVYDNLSYLMRQQQVHGLPVNKTTRGSYVLPPKSRGGGNSPNNCPL